MGLPKADLDNSTENLPSGVPAASEDAGNHLSGATGKTVLTKDGSMRMKVQRDREVSVAPVLIPKHGRRFTRFDDKIVARCARGMPAR